LADEYLEFYDTSYEGYDNLKNCLKYLSKAYRIDPNDAKINNAVGYILEAYYDSSDDAFSSLQSTALSRDDLAVKVISLYLKAIEADPTYKAAYGNLYNYCSDKYGGVDKNLAMQKVGIDDTFLDGYYSNSLDENGITQMGFLRY
jgi:tetratricopeptide (TPR) repeat protein